MSKQLYENLLKALIKANKVRKQKLAERAGYASVEGYKQFLESQAYGDRGIPITQESKKVIHIVDVVDCSSSMDGPKINSAREGVANGLSNLKEGKEGINYTYTLCLFSNSHKITFPYLNEKLDKVTNISFKANGYTALNDAIGKVFQEVKYSLDEKVLVNVYTDGGENDSRKFKSDTIKEFIDSHKETHTVTFIGTEYDTRNVQNFLGIDRSNTLSYDGSAAGLAVTMMQTNSARSSFAKKVVKGEDVKTGFYKSVN